MNDPCEERNARYGLREWQAATSRRCRWRRLFVQLLAELAWAAVIVLLACGISWCLWFWNARSYW